MAAVTVNKQNFNISGRLREQIYNITGVSGSTLVVGLISVRAVLVDPSVISAISVASATPAQGQSTITFTSSGAFTTDVVVKGN